MISRPFLLVLYALVQVQRGISAVSNRTIDDGKGDEVTGALPVYSPPDKWNVVVANNCTTCFVKLDPVQVVDQTWHDTTVPVGTTASVTLNFTGTAVYFFGIVPNTVPSADTLVNLTFSLDGAFAGAYTHIPDTSTEILYSVPMLSKDGLSNEAHTLVAQPQSGSLLLFDYATYTFDDGNGTGITSVIPSSASVIPSSASTALPVTGAHKSPQSETRAKLGGALGGAVGIVALLAAVAPSPGASPDFDFFFVFPLPITFRGKTLQDAQITVVLRPVHLALTDEQPKSGFTFAKPTSHELAAWKVITICELISSLAKWFPTCFSIAAKKEGQSVRLPKDLGFGDVLEEEGRLIKHFFNFAPLRTLVTKTTSAAWKSARFIIPGLGAMVVANNAAPQPVDFTLGTYHAKKDKMKDDFCPFVVVREVLNSQFCVAPQCDELVVNAYITQNIDERQLLTGLLDPADSYANHPIPDGPFNTQEDPNAAPQPTIEDDDADYRSPKILSGPLIGENGKGELVSTLKHKTKWHLVDDSQGLRLKLVTDAEA